MKWGDIMTGQCRLLIEIRQWAENIGASGQDEEAIINSPILIDKSFVLWHNIIYSSGRKQRMTLTEMA
jgi:hypothetical protein